MFRLKVTTLLLLTLSLALIACAEQPAGPTATAAPPHPTETVAQASPEASVTPSPPATPEPAPQANMFRGDAGRSGVYHSQAQQNEWFFTTGAPIISSPFVSGRRLFVASGDGNLYAIDLTTGKELWLMSTDEPFVASPVGAGGLVTIAGTDGRFYAVDEVTGDVVWQFEAGIPSQSSAAIAGGRVYYGSVDGTVFALDQQTGEEVWRFAAGDQVLSSPAVVGDSLYFGSFDGYLYALEATSGEQLWRFSSGEGIASSPAVVDGLVYFGNGTGLFYALDAATGKQLWQFQTEGPIQSSPAVVGGTVYFGSFDRQVYALDAKTGQELWRFDAQEAMISSPAVADGLVYVGTLQGRMYALDAADGQEVWRFQTEADIYSSPVVVAEQIYFGSFDKRVYALGRLGPEVALVPTATAQPLAPTPTPWPTPSTPVATGTEGLPWWNDRVFYEVFVRSFRDSDGDGNGDLQGLIDRLDYLNDGDPNTDDDLGVTGIWLMPVTEAASYHGYDTVDYKQIEEDFGSNEDFQTLLEEAHRRGIAVIVDLVMNHTSSEHPWFQDALIPGSEHEPWYIWSGDAPDYLSPWGSPVWHKVGNRYYYGLFWEGMPDLNYENGAVTEAMYDIIRFWLEDMDVDGFRLDAVRHLIEDGPVQENTPATHAWLEGFYNYVHTLKPDALTVGEAWTSSEEIVKYVGDEVDMAFEFGLAEAMLDAVRRQVNFSLVEAQQQALDLYPPGQYAAFLTNHDQNRVMSQLRNDVPAAKVAATLLLTNPGLPFIYYGEEIGMVGAGPDENKRTPMQWDGSATAGFTSGTPWEPLADADEGANVVAQDEDPDSLLNHYRALIRLRQAHPALRAGDMVLVPTGNSRVYAFLRADESERLLVLINLFHEPVSDYSLDLESGPLSGVSQARLLLGQGQPAAPQVNEAGGLAGYRPLETLPARSSTIIELTG